MLRVLLAAPVALLLSSCGPNEVLLPHSLNQSQNDIFYGLPVETARRFLFYYGGVSVEKSERPGQITVSFVQDGSSLGTYHIKLEARGADQTAVSTSFSPGEGPSLADDHIDARKAVSGIVVETFDEAVSRQPKGERVSNEELDRTYTEWTSAHPDQQEAIQARIVRSLQGKLR
jgi:hypothetical protein